MKTRTAWPPELSEPLFRPPSEARSLILQLTEGCSWNRCTYCAMYRSKRYRVRPVDDVVAEVRGAAAMGMRPRRLFLADGDALAAPTDALVTVLEAVREHLPDVQRVGVYGDSRAILARGPEALSSLRDLGLGIVYFGAETGDPETLRSVRKGTTVARQVEASRMVREAGLKLSVMVLLGLAGVQHGERHARATGRFLVEAAPTYAAALVVTPVPGTEMHDDVVAGRFQLPSRWESLQELRWMLEEMEGFRGPFHANHASNHLPLKLRLPRDRDGALALIDDVLARRDESRLRPEWMRGL